MRLLFDENVPKIVVDHFRNLKIDLKTVVELSLSQAPDQEIVKKANKLRRTIVTCDLGLIKITSYSDATKFGLIQIRYQNRVTAQLLAVVSSFVKDFTKKSLKDTLVVIDEEKYNVFRGRFHEYS